jgi:general secretion pathway protein D
MIGCNFHQWKQATACAASLATVLLASCARPPFTYVEPRIGDPPRMTDSAKTVAAADEEQEPAPLRVSGPVIADEPPSQAILRHAATAPVIASPQARGFVTEAGDVSLNYVDADIKEVVRLILGSILKVNYTIDPGFQGTVTIQTPHPIKHDALLATLQGLLEQAGGTMTFRNGMFRISDSTDESIVSPIISSTSPESGTQVVSLRYASARQIATVIERYIGDGAKVAADPGRNVLIVTGSAAARQSITDLIRVFDVDYLAGQSYALFAAKSGDPAKLAADLNTALQIEGDGPLLGAVRIVPISAANAVMVIAPQAGYVDRVGGLIAELDQARAVSGRNIHVYYLKNVQAADIQPVLQRAVNPPAGGGSIGDIAPGNLPPTATPAQIGAPQNAPAQPNAMGGGAMAAGLGIPAGLGGTSGAPQGPAPMTPQADADAGGGAAGANARGPQIIADRTNAALIIVATDSEYATIEAAIRKLDVLPMQVLIEATVAEVTLNNQLQYGTQFFLGNNLGQATLSNAQSGPTVLSPPAVIGNDLLFPGTLAPAFPAFAIARTIGEQQFAIQALKDITNVEIISAPKLLVLDQQQARLQVGDLVPTITQSATSVISAGAPVVNNVQYQATGVILTVTPRINSGGLVTLDIEQEVSDVVPTNSSSINSPTFQQRKITTKVVVQNGETISLGGMISAKKTKDNSGIPFAQDIPVLGALFSTRTNSDERTELLILLTPRVINDQRDARELTEELKRKLAPGSLTP